MSKKVYGKIKDSNTGQGVKGLRVEAWDDDMISGDDFMGADMTNDNGNYSISYHGGHWDPSLSHGHTVWRPDIYIRVEGKNAAGKWVKLAKSGVHSDHRLRNDLRINLSVDFENPITKNTAFDPQKHGFHFVNSFTVAADLLGVDLGSWKMGFCGGMCAAALNRFNKNIPIPPDTNTPAQGTALYNELRDRQIDTLLHPNNILDDIYVWQSAPDEGSFFAPHSIRWRTKNQWPELQNNLEANKPTILLLIRQSGYLANPTKNHQVLAIGYKYHPTFKDLWIYVYDPNKPDTTQTLYMNLKGKRLNAKDSTGKRLRGFFCNPNSESASR